MQYVGATAMAGSLVKKSLLQLADLRSLPKLAVLAEFLKPGIPLGFCIASAMTLVVSATNLAAGKVPLHHEVIFRISSRPWAVQDYCVPENLCCRCLVFLSMNYNSQGMNSPLH